MAHDPNQTTGFQMSGKRILIELGLIVGGLLGAVLLVLWVARAAAGSLATMISPDVDRAMGEQAFRAVTVNACTNPEPQKYVMTAAQPLLNALGKTPYDFQFIVADDPEVNAFALPGGFVTVNMGLLKAVESGDEVAAVLAHELQHVLRRHGTQRILRELGGGTILYALFGGTNIGVPVSMVANFVHTAYDRDQETEADKLGQELMIHAGIDPRAMAHFFERLSKTSVTPPEILSTHPDPGHRAAVAAEAAKGKTFSLHLPPPPKTLSCR